MKKTVLLLAGLVLCLCFVNAQAPNSFPYQAVVRDNSGNPLISHAVGLKISIVQGSEAGSPVYAETFSVITNAFGIVTLPIGQGTAVSGSFSSIDWSAGTYFLKTELDATGGTEYQPMGTTQLLSVPYALYSQKTNSNATFEVNGTEQLDPGTALFEVKDKNGLSVFAVYEDGVVVTVNNTPKGGKGGFAVGGRSPGKGVVTDIMRVTPDSVRIYINDDPLVKGGKGGFSVGGRSPGKGVQNEYLTVNGDSTRIYTTDTLAGFGIGNHTGTATNGYLRLTPKNYFIGHSTGAANLTGLYNSFLGYKSGMKNTTGNNNLFLGYFAGWANIDASFNSFVGNESGRNNTSGGYNSFFGYQSGFNNTIGQSNLFLGYQSGYSNTTGNFNSFVGYKAGYANTTGTQNTFVGSYSGTANNSGTNNTFVGYQSGLGNTSGTANNFFGTLSGYSNTTGGSNVFVGPESGYKNLDGNYNVLMGYRAGYNNTSGGSNVFLGNQAGFTNTTSSYNNFVGYQSGYNNSTGTFNSFMGYRAGYSNSTGANNIFIGDSAGVKNTGGIENVYIGSKVGISSNASQNVFIGYLCGYSNTAYSSNVYIGNRAGYSNNGGNNIFIGRYAGSNATSSLNSILIGVGAGKNNLAGQNNTMIGNVAGGNGSSGDHDVYIGDFAGSNAVGSGNVFLGYNAGMNEIRSNKLYIDNSSTSKPLIWGDFNFNRVVINGDSLDNPSYFNFYVNGSAGGDNSWNTISDMRVKENITTIPGALEKVMKLRGVNFMWKEESRKSEGLQMGFIAQEAEKVIPEVVNRSADLYSMEYAPVTALLVEAMKEQEHKIESLEQENTVLRAKLETLESIQSRLDHIEQLIGTNARK